MPNFNYLYENIDNKMRNLRFYENGADFKAKEIAAGGTGIDVESVVPGIVKTLDERKMYFNPHDKEIQFHTLTINYKSTGGKTLAPSTTVRIKYFSGVTQEISVFPANVDGYKPVDVSKSVAIPEQSSVNFIYDNKHKSDYLTLNILSSGTIVWKATDYRKTASVSFSKNNGNTWADITSTTVGTSFNVNAGEKVMFKGDNATYTSGTSRYNTFSGSTAVFSVEGNIMSLIDSTGFKTAATLASSYTFFSLFSNCTGLTSVENLVLPATTLAQYCYQNMFQGCTSLTTAPELPATTLADNCYQSMFSGCTSLTTAPSILPATTLGYQCYSSMFYGCTKLTSAPELPATTLTSYCYSNMFNGCTSLTTAPSIGTSATTMAYYACNSMFSGCTSLTTAPELPATTLESYCYCNMFHGCTSLTTAPSILPATQLKQGCYEAMFFGCTSLRTAPELPATDLPHYCYQSMFTNCSSLNYIKCLATFLGYSDYNTTSNWVNGVASAGTFVKPASTDWSQKTGNDGIPTNWTVQDV